MLTVAPLSAHSLKNSFLFCLQSGILMPMKAEILKIADSSKESEILKKAAGLIDSGGLVVFPTETVYGIACKADKQSLAKLDEVKKREADKRYALHIGDKNKLADFVPHLFGPEKKLVANAWPGPVTIIFEIEQKDIDDLKTKFSAELIEILYKDSTIGVRCPENEIAHRLLNLCKSPVVAPSANTSNSEPATDAQQAISQLGEIVDMIIDGGKCKYKTSSTVVKISQNDWHILREGVYSADKIRKMLTVNILFVCTGNTCRSPMAEGLAKKLLAKKLKTNIDRLEYIGYKVTSAGIVAMGDTGASPESIRFCNSKGVDITNHITRHLTAEMVADADYIFVMSGGHKNDIIKQFLSAAGKCLLLDESGDIEDPIGRGYEIYMSVGQTIEKAVNKRIGDILQ